METYDNNKLNKSLLLTTVNIDIVGLYIYLFLFLVYECLALLAFIITPLHNMLEGFANA